MNHKSLFFVLFGLLVAGLIVAGAFFAAAIVSAPAVEAAPAADFASRPLIIETGTAFAHTQRMLAVVSGGDCLGDNTSSDVYAGAIDGDMDTAGKIYLTTQKRMTDGIWVSTSVEKQVVCYVPPAQPSIIVTLTKTVHDLLTATPTTVITSTPTVPDTSTVTPPPSTSTPVPPTTTPAPTQVSGNPGNNKPNGGGEHCDQGKCENGDGTGEHGGSTNDCGKGKNDQCATATPAPVQ